MPAIARPFVRLRIDPELCRFDFLGYAVAARAPILLLSCDRDEIVRPGNMRAFADQLCARGGEVNLVSVPGGHGMALREAQAAVAAFVARHSRR